MEMFERLDYYARERRWRSRSTSRRADEIHGGLATSAVAEGLHLFMLWGAGADPGVPVFAGGFADRYGYKEDEFAVSFPFFFLPHDQEGRLPDDGRPSAAFWSFTAGCLVLALRHRDLQARHPGHAAAVARQENSSDRRGMFYMLRSTSAGSWTTVRAINLYGSRGRWWFYGAPGSCRSTSSLLFTYKGSCRGRRQSGGNLKGAAHQPFAILISPGSRRFYLFCSGFWCDVHAGVRTLLPNFIVD